MKHLEEALHLGEGRAGQERSAGRGNDVNQNDGDVDEGDVVQRLHGVGEQTRCGGHDEGGLEGQEVSENEGPREKGARCVNFHDDGRDCKQRSRVGHNVTVGREEGKSLKSLHERVRWLPFTGGEHAEEEERQHARHVSRILAGEVTKYHQGDGTAREHVKPN